MNNDREANREGHQVSARVREWLAQRASARVWRGVIAFLASFLTVVCVCGGLMMWAWWLQAGLIAGVVAGLIASSVPSAAIVAGLGANVLIGGFKKSISLQPLSVQVQTGLNVAAGVAGTLAATVTTAVAKLFAGS